MFDQTDLVPGHRLIRAEAGDGDVLVRESGDMEAQEASPQLVPL
ncbi:hypothetical protein [Histidinibacterium lentulum]|nr:hypothetical protein [Histidinibacterium lentulum]